MREARLAYTWWYNCLFALIFFGDRIAILARTHGGVLSKDQLGTARRNSNNKDMASKSSYFIYIATPHFIF